MCDIASNEYDEIAAKYFESGWKSGVNECLLEIRALRTDIKPMMDFFAAIPEAIESNPMMNMMFGKALKRK